MNSGIDAISATEDTFSFVDNTEMTSEVAQNIELPRDEEEVSEFEGFGSMFD